MQNPVAMMSGKIHRKAAKIATAPAALIRNLLSVLAAATIVASCSGQTSSPDAAALAGVLASAVAQHEAPAQKEQMSFAAAAQSYRAAAVKPVPGEDVRRFAVQAEAAVREKRFEDAAADYAKALEIAPWWPEGRYNRALILAELGEFAQAVTEMQDYLALVPNAPNARKVQDKIYEWEAKPSSNRCERIAGVWNYFNGFLVGVAADGTVFLLSGHQATSGGTWECVDKSAGRINIHWTTGFIDDMTLNANANELDGVNQFGFAVSATLRPPSEISPVQK